MEEVLKDPYEKVAIKYFDFMAWIDSKIEKKSFANLIQSKN